MLVAEPVEQLGDAKLADDTLGRPEGQAAIVSDGDVRRPTDPLAVGMADDEVEDAALRGGLYALLRGQADRLQMH